MSDTLVLRLPVAESASNKTFEQRLTALCNIQAAAGYKVAATIPMGLDIIIIFQK